MQTLNTTQKLSKQDYISFLMDCKAYTEEEARQYIAVEGVSEIEEQAQSFYAPTLNSYEQKQQNKKERLLARSESLEVEATRVHDEGMTALRAIPFGQPVMPDHHSYRSDIAYRRRATGKIEKSFNLSKKASLYQQRAEAVGTGGISSDDPDAITKLMVKLGQLKKKHETMLSMNAEARRKKQEKPCPTYMLSNSNANIKRVERRIDELRSKATMTLRDDIVTDLYTMREDREDNRIHFIFEGKPEDEIRSILRRNAFKWSPTRGAWVRQLTQNGRRGADRVMSAIAEVV